MTPLDRVGIYVPGGKAAYPSSVLMNAIPAQVAGVGEIVMVVPTPNGQRNPLVLAAAHVAGVHRVFTLGGAQAIAALAYGTATMPRVDKIIGPGNAYVASAKRRVFGQVGIDMIAGPSEILVLADGSTDPDWVAMDLFSQAEHDELAQSILLSPDAAYLDAVAAAIERLLPSLPRRDVIRASLEGRGALIHTRSMEEACAISNRIAPEHLEISAREPQRWEPLLKHAGAIFLGAFTSESLGDYCAGPNHVLPTSGTARFSSPLGVYDFVKRSSLIEVSARARRCWARSPPNWRWARACRRTHAPRRCGSVPPAMGAQPLSSAHGDRRQRRPADPARGGARSARPGGLGGQIARAGLRAPPGRPLGIYDGDEPVGLLLLWDVRRDPDEPADQLYVWRLMIDAKHQKKGYGARAMRWVIDEARRLGVASVGLSHQMLPGHAGPFYQKLGFRYTGKVEHNEHLMVLQLSETNRD